MKAIGTLCQPLKNVRRFRFARAARFEQDDSPTIKRYRDSNTGLLFHGTRSVNCVGLLRESFRQPKELVGVTITGAMFGQGVAYTADDWKKSAGYTSLRGSYWSSGGGYVPM